MAYWRLHYHLIWAAYRRLPLLDAPREMKLQAVIVDKCRELGVIFHAIGNIEDHVHVVVSIPPRHALADCLKHFKGASSRALGQMDGDTFKWQEGYGAISLDQNSLTRVIRYALNQKQHHAQGTTLPTLEQITEADDGPSS